jgi:predicted alpha/beta hydrolase family esterase
VPRLRAAGELVRYPDLPEPFDPDPEVWLSVLREELAALEGERTVICHSLAVRLWLLFARDGAAAAAQRVLLVAPPCRDDIPAIRRFRPDGVMSEHVMRAAAQTRMVCAPDGDPYCPDTAPQVYGHLEVPTDLIEGGGHLNSDAGYGPWPALEAWALGKREDVAPR